MLPLGIEHTAELLLLEEPYKDALPTELHGGGLFLLLVSTKCQPKISACEQHSLS